MEIIGQECYERRVSYLNTQLMQSVCDQYLIVSQFFCFFIQIFPDTNLIFLMCYVFLLNKLMQPLIHQVAAPQNNCSVMIVVSIYGCNDESMLKYHLMMTIVLR